MKVKLLPLAIGAAIAMPGVAMADVDVYGKMNLTLEMADYEFEDSSSDYDRWELNSNASRLGVKGSEDINDNLSAFYKAEYEIFPDDGSDGRGISLDGEVFVDLDGDGNPDDTVEVDASTDRTFKQRDIYVGLKGGWGAVQLGNFDTPLKKSQGKIDQFNNMSSGDLKNVLTGENRESNLIQYSSPAIADAITLNVAIQPGEEACPDGANNNCDDGLADNYSLSAVYSTDMLYLSAAMDDGIDGEDVMRVTGIFYIDVFEIGAMYQTAEESEDSAGDPADEQDGYILSAGMKLGESNKLRFQYGSSELDENYEVAGDGFTDTLEITQIAIGVDHKLSKQTKLFANYITLEEEFKEDGVSGTSTDEVARLQLGLEHKF